MTVMVMKKINRVKHFPVLGVVSDSCSGLWIEEAGSQGAGPLGS